MKKMTWILSALGAVSGIANAQSSVTIYGIIDEGLIFNSNANGPRQSYLASGVLSGSRIGFGSLEALGGIS